VLVVVAVVALAAAAVVGAARLRHERAAARLARGAVVSAVTSELGLSTTQLRADLVSGQTLAQIATARGKPVAGLEQAILGAVQSRLVDAVAAGKLSAGQEQKLLARIGPRLAKLLNAQHPVARLVLRARVRAFVVRTAAQYLALTPLQLRSDLGAGQTLAQVAAANGKTVDGLEQAVQGAARTRLDNAVSAGRISAPQEQALLSRLATRLAAVAG